MEASENGLQRLPLPPLLPQPLSFQLPSFLLPCVLLKYLLVSLAGLSLDYRYSKRLLVIALCVNYRLFRKKERNETVEVEWWHLKKTKTMTCQEKMNYRCVLASYVYYMYRHMYCIMLYLLYCHHVLYIYIYHQCQ